MMMMIMIAATKDPKYRLPFTNRHPGILLCYNFSCFPRGLGVGWI